MTSNMHFVNAPNELMDPDQITALSGLEFIQGICTGQLPAPPICKTLNFWMVEAAPGRVVFESEPEFGAMNPIGSVHGGWFGTLLDSAMACAVQTTLAPGQLYTTLEYKVNILRPVMPDGTRYQVIGEVEHSGRRTGVARGKMINLSTSKLHATGSTTCMNFTP